MEFKTVEKKPVIAKQSNGERSSNHPVSLLGPGPSFMTHQIIERSKTASATVTSGALQREMLSQGPSPQEQIQKVSCFECGELLNQLAINPEARRFCSAVCAKNCLRKEREKQGLPPFNPVKKKKKLALPISHKNIPFTPVRPEDLGEESSRSSTGEDHYLPPKKKKKKEEDTSFRWMGVLNTSEFTAASVSLIKHAPLTRLWDNITVGMKVEVENRDIDYRIAETAYWVAGVIEIHGYYVLLRYEGFGNDKSGDFWTHLCSSTVHHVGWCANKGKPLIPPRSIAKKFSDWRNFLVNRLTGARTLPLNFQSKILNGTKSTYQVGHTLEVVDKNQISQLRLATIKQIVGKRLQVQYFDSTEDGGFWCHEESRLIHPEGWATTIGHRILGPAGYYPNNLPATVYDAEYEALQLKVGMKLEAIDPLNLSAICAATIKQVLRRGYVMVRIDSYEEDSSGFDWFCYHISSPCVYPCGFCAESGIVLTPPTGYDKSTFNWDSYFAKNPTASPAPIKPKKPINHKFKVGMKVEAADLMDPRLICVATISQVVGRLLKIHFDGWEDDYDQWMDARSPDIYPIGWCELVQHKLEPPRPPLPIAKTPAPKKPKKGKKKVTVAKGGKAAAAKNAAKINNVAAGNSKNGTPKSQPAMPVNTTTVPKSVPKPPQASSSSNIIKTVNSTTTKNSTGIIKPEKTPSVPGLSHNGDSVNKVPLLIVEPNTNNSSIKISNQPAAPSTSTSANSGKNEDNPNSKDLNPFTWTTHDVVKFLLSHDCGSYCEGFMKNDVDGEKLMALNKDQIIFITGMKVGPAVKIFELVSQLKKKYVSVVKARKALPL